MMSEITLQQEMMNGGIGIVSNASDCNGPLATASNSSCCSKQTQNGPLQNGQTVNEEKSSVPLHVAEATTKTTTTTTTSSSSCTKGHEEMSVSPASSPSQLRICLVGTVVDDPNTLAAAQTFGVPVITSETGAEFISDTDWLTYFILNDFDGPIFKAVQKTKHRILGPPALQQAVDMKEGLVFNNRPIYNYSMKGVITCFTGIRKKDELTRLVNLIHSMGGSIRRELNSKITHLICNTTGGEKYQYAMTFRLSVIKPTWVYEAWDKRDEKSFQAIDVDFTKPHKLRAFEGQKICFLGFAPEEHQHMIDVLTSNGGIATDIEDPDCSHVVVDEHSVQTKPENKNRNTHIVKSDWFWYTIQNGYADELDYLFENYLESIGTTTLCHDRRESLPISFNNRKRKRLQRAALDTTPRGTNKRRSSVSDAGLLSVSGSFLDYTASPTAKHESKELDASVQDHAPKKRSMRYNHFMDLFGTESNYVGILHTIVSLFQKPLEDMADTSDALLNKSEVRAIFNNFSPIHDVHLEMLNRFRELQADWSEDCLIGKIILDHREALIKAYPPYVNFFEQMKETLIQCDNQNPRFHAFLKINQAKAECGRQTLQDLMIRPVQRLPSISLLISDILKHTPKNNPDFVELEKALKAIKEVMTYINEDKRKTEGRFALFDIFNDIDNCPPDLVSSHRSFISKCEVTELSNILSGRDDPIMLFLFTDYMEVCKIKKSRFNSVKSPTGNGLNATRVAHQKSFKHIKLLPLSSISVVYDIKDSPRAFALPHKDKMYSFSICDELDKIIYLKSLCKQLAENACRADAEQFLRSYDSSELGIDISDINLGTLKKAFNYARTRLKVTRAFSFNKTPMKLKRTVTTSPLFGSTNSLTPATQLAQMKLASCTNINEVGENGDEEEDDDGSSGGSGNDINTGTMTKSGSVKRPEVLIAPMSVQPTRKNKSSTLSIAALRRL